RIDDLIDSIKTYSSDADIEMVVRAYMFSAQAHNGQTRKSGEDYLIHPLAVAKILADLRMDIDTIATGLLHDTMEDCLTTRQEITAAFGEEVADMVDGVTKIGKLQFRSREEAQAENFRKLILAMSRDVRVILVKLADRLHNMRTMEHMKEDRRRAISRETMEIFAPIANRLGLSKVKSELEDLSFRYLHPDIHDALQEQMEQRAPDHADYIRRMMARLEQALNKQRLDARVTGRVKHLVSVYRKMQNKHLEFDQVHDLLAFRILVDEPHQCYTTLGIIHGLFPHVPKRLKDYIAHPKSNGYQSLHTVVVSPEGHEVEIQIRTWEMHRVAEVGIAAHWRYKEGHLALSREEVTKIARLRTLFEVAHEIQDPTEFMETLKIDLFSDEIFVFTPKGDVKFFPHGATTLDFAYSIHTDIGDTTTGGKVNGKLVPLRYRLQNGDRIEILTNPNQRPNRDWLNIAKTGRALTKIRRVIREEERERGRALGKELLEAELKKYDLSLSKLIKSGQMDEIAHQFGHRRADQMYLDVAQGNTILQKVVAAIVPEEERNPPTTTSNLLNSLMNIARPRKRSVSPVLISGQEDVLTTYARCCNPLPGEPVTGYITRGRGITVHKQDCSQLLSLDTERRIEVQWHKEAKSRHTGELEILCNDATGMLADIGAVCKTLSINVSRMNAESIDDRKALLKLEVSVTNVSELERLLRNLEKIKGVIRARRL
ncbi:MAG: bifunctional (p)ppGpp synthetase/guanosine-3',5'-bis(diphosphate) 3'-pyrophosphohydrolase, partial [Myxococcota bacterium]